MLPDFGPPGWGISRGDTHSGPDAPEAFMSAVGGCGWVAIAVHHQPRSDASRYCWEKKLVAEEGLEPPTRGL